MSEFAYDHSSLSSTKAAARIMRLDITPGAKLGRRCLPPAIGSKSKEKFSHQAQSWIGASSLPPAIGIKTKEKISNQAPNSVVAGLRSTVVCGTFRKHYCD